MYLPLANLRQGIGRSDQDITRFQKALQQYLGVRACYLASSARTALYLLLQTLSKAEPNRVNVLLPAYTCPALVKVIQDVGLWPYPIDISPDTFAFDAEQLANHLNEQVLALICVHPFGIPQAIEEQIIQAHAVGAVVIEDAAQAMGAGWQGQPVGVRGDFGLFSLGPGKPLSVGGGGLVCTNDQTQAQVLKQSWQHLPPASARVSAWSLARLLLIRLATHPRGWWLAARFGMQSWGLNPKSWSYTYRQLSQAQARVGLAQLSELDQINQVRCENGRQLTTRLQDFDFVHIPQIPAEADPIYLRLPIIVDTAERREQLYHALWSANLGAGRLYHYSLPEIFPQIETLPCPGAVQIGQRLLMLPTHHYLTLKDITRISDIFLLVGKN
jgi:dTDP-4-amino-4,6-dideoxygalactose transaminase